MPQLGDLDVLEGVPQADQLAPEQQEAIKMIAAMVIAKFLQSMLEQPSAWRQFLGGGEAPRTAPTIPPRGSVRGIKPRDLAPRTAAPLPGSTDVSTTGAVIPGKKGIPGGLKTNAARGAALVRQKFGFKGDIGGMRAPGGKPSDHHHGNAIDVMTRGNRSQGNQIKDYFIQNAKELGVKYVIYEQKIYGPQNGWKGDPMEDRGR